MNSRRNLTAVALVHAAVILASPAFAALMFLCLTLDVRSSVHFGGVLALAFALLFSYLFYGAKTLLLVLLTSPMLWGLAKLKWQTLAFVLAAGVGGGLGWLFGHLLMTGEDKGYVASASLAAAITGALAALALEAAWRVWPPGRDTESAHPASMSGTLSGSGRR